MVGLHTIHTNKKLQLEYKKILRIDVRFFGHNEKKNNYLLQEQSNRKTTKIITITTASGKTIGVKSKGKNTSLLDYYFRLL